MGIESRADLEVIAGFIRQLAERSNVFGHMAGVGGMETAGSAISYLAVNPKDLEPYLNGGLLELPADWFQRGCLTYHATGGKVTHPQDARFARIVNGLKEPNDG
jgi:hypothetical protein